MSNGRNTFWKPEGTAGSDPAPRGASISAWCACAPPRTGAGFCAPPMTASPLPSTRPAAYAARCRPTRRPLPTPVSATSRRRPSTRVSATGSRCCRRALRSYAWWRTGRRRVGPVLSKEEIGGHVEQLGELLRLRLADRALAAHNLRGYAAGTKHSEQVALAQAVLFHQAAQAAVGR